MKTNKIKKDKETIVSVKDLIYPLFVKEGTRIREEIPYMPGIHRYSPDAVCREVRTAVKRGIRAVLLFGVPGEKDKDGSSAREKDAVVAKAVKRLKLEFPKLSVMTDVCLCAYTSHGHCGVIRPGRRTIDHKATLEALSKMALSHADSGADYVAPSAMAKCQVSAIRKTLDAGGFKDTKIMGYSAKYASNFYGPFRRAACSSPVFGDRSAYQLPYSDGTRSAIRKIEDDIKEGADIVMVKPALAYLDIIKDASSRFKFPLAAYNVSGEYAFVKQGAKLGLWDERKMVLEIITSIKRAGADIVITYHAKDIARWLKER